MRSRARRGLSLLRTQPPVLSVLFLWLGLPASWQTQKSLRKRKKQSFGQRQNESKHMRQDLAPLMLRADHRKEQKNKFPIYATLAGWGQVGHCCSAKGHALLYPKDTGMAQSKKQKHRKVFVGIKKSEVCRASRSDPDK